MNRTSKFLKNSFTTALFQIITMVTGFLLSKVMLSVYGSETNGLVTSITQFISYLTLVETGLSGATIFSLYKPLAFNDTDRINSILTAAKKFYYRTGYLFLIMVSFMAFTYPLFINTQLFNYHEITLLFFILGFNGVLEFFTLAKYRTLLTADQKTYVISCANIIQIILNTSIIITVSYLGASIIFARLFALISILIRSLILWIYCKQKYKFLNFSMEPDYSSLNKRWDALYMQIIGIIHNGAPILIASFILTLNDVSIYSIYHLVVNGVNSILGIFTSGLSSSFGDIIARDEKENFKISFIQFEYIYYIIITIAYSTMMVCYIPFIELYTRGSDINYSFKIIAILMTLNGYFYSLKTPFGMLTISAGKYRESRTQISIQGLLAIVLGVVFGIKWGLIGIILGAIISNIYRDIDFIFFAPKHLTYYSFKGTLKMWIRSIVIMVLISLMWLFTPGEPITSYLDWLKFAFKVGIISTLITLIINIIIDYKIFKQVIRRFKNIILAR